MSDSTTPPHLGGFGTGEHGDEATFFPDMWTWLVRQRGIKSVLDIGCGPAGIAVEFFHSLGADAKGIEGVPSDNPNIMQHDFTTGVPVGRLRRFDLGWMCEFLEHLEERFLPNVAPAIQACDTVLMTHAFPGQGGHHHVNCRKPEYWGNWFGLLGFRLDEDMTAACRAIAALNPSPYNHFVRSGLCFQRVE